MSGDWFDFGFHLFLLALIGHAWFACCRERRARLNAEEERESARWTAEYYRDAYEGIVHPRTRSSVSVAREGFAAFTTVDEIAGRAK